MVGDQPLSRDEDRSPVGQDDPYPEWGFNEIDPEIETAPGTIEIDGQEFPYDRYGRANAGAELFIDSATADGITFHALGISDSEQNVVRLAAPLFGSDNNVTFDLSGDGDGDPVAPGSYVVINAISEEEPRAFQPLCVQAYEGTVTGTASGPTPTVSVTVSEVVEDPPAIEDPQLVVWNDTVGEQRVPMEEAGDSTFEGTLSGFDPGTYSLHALLRDGTGENAQVVGLSGTASVEVVAQTGLTFAVDGQSDSATIDEGATVPYAATAAFEDGSEQDVTDAVDVTVADGDPAVVAIDDAAAEITGAEPGTVTLEADDGEFTDTVEVTVEGVLAALEFEIAGQSGTVTIDEGETVAYGATAVFSDGSEDDVTAEASVTSADPAVVSVDQGATEVSGEGPGEGVPVTAEYQTETDTVDVTVPGSGETDVALPDVTIPPGGEADLPIDGTAVETLTVEDLWTDWEVTAADADGAETTDAVAPEGWFELAWESQQAGVAPTLTVALPEEYIGGEYKFEATAAGSDGSTAADTAIVTIDD